VRAFDRWEGVDKAFGAVIMVSESTWSQARCESTGQQIGLMRIVARKTPARAFVPLAHSTEAA